MKKISKMCCGCGSEHVSFCIQETEDGGTSDFDKDLRSIYGEPFGTIKGCVIDSDTLKSYILDTYRNNVERFFMTDFAMGTCFGSCEDETETAITFEDGTHFEFQNDNNSLYTFDEFLRSEEKALLYMFDITNAEIIALRGCVK